nr:(2Fe-2S)-binding protein [Bradyrhizobium sp. UNPA324]
MIICSCNFFSDRDVRHAVNTADAALRNAKQIYGHPDCTECGRCAHTVRTIIDEAYRERSLARQTCRPHGGTKDE